MASTQKISCKSMKSDSEALEEALKDIPGCIEQLQVAMRNLARCWEGPAWEAFQVQVNQDVQNMQEVYSILAEIQKGLGEGRDKYLKTEYEVYKKIKWLWI